MSETQQAVRVERLADHVALVTIDRPEARNAVSGAVAAGLEAAIDQTEADDDVWVVVLTGAGSEAFCAGADLKAVAAGRGSDLATARGGFAGFVHAPKRKPWIAAVNGPALAGGCEIALACDLIVASTAARFGLPEVKRGLIASAGGLYRLPRALPPAIAREMIATGDPIPAERAHALGMVNVLVEPAQLLEAAKALAARITVNAPVSVRESLAVARRAFDDSDATLRKASEDGQVRNMASEDFKEGPRAFIEKRAPRWVGR
ncbi:MAG: enoyl-CoA hydratase/isomerase family protein [Burkholderiaceae bacterium]|nr:enoyl-CoA hydratase/isomerase family protein [Burkholderiaceae bacterium]